MNDIPEVYYLETIEQVRAIADELRQRIHDALRQRAMTVTQLGAQLGIAPAKIHYHVREMERVGLLRLVETREKGGILEKYYRPVAWSLNVPRSLLHSLSPDEYIGAVGDILQEASESFLRALAHTDESSEGDQNNASLSRTHLWMTDDEFTAVVDAIEDVLQDYQSPRGIPGERERSFVHIIYETAAGERESSSKRRAKTKSSAGTVNPHRTWILGGTSWNRDRLEGAVDRGEVLDVTVIGFQSFADDISADLVDRAIGNFRHRGILRASPEVREVLKRKESAS
jgi:predicted transcriptional regulator